MQSVAQLALLFVCGASALFTLFVFLKTWFSGSATNHFLARRASGAYGVVTVFVPMRGPVAKVEQTIRSIFSQSYPFIELVLTYAEEDKNFGTLAKDFRRARSHIPVRLVPTLFPIESENDRIRALDHALPGVRGRWFVVIEPGLILDRFAVETALEFAGSNEISALVLDVGTRCRGTLETLIAPSLDHLFMKSRTKPLRPEFLLVHREAFEVVNRVNRMPGILNDAGWDMWGYEVEGLRIFEADGSRWIWREADVRSWLSQKGSPVVVIANAIVPVLAMLGFAGWSTMPFSAVTYTLMSISYFFSARRLDGAWWFAPFWFLSHIPAALIGIRSLNLRHAESEEPVRQPHSFL